MKKSIFLFAILVGSILLAQGKETVTVEEIPGQAPLECVEILGVSAGPFNPALWEANQLNWVPDVRVPFQTPRQGGLFRNIYAPAITEEPYGWRLFYGAWDGVPTGNDRIYSVTTRDFIDFDNHTIVIEHGDFIHVCNVNVQKIEDGSYHLICTAYPDQNQQNKPIYFSSRDGRIWNKTPEPHSAKMSELVDVKNYDKYALGDLNGGNVLLRDQGKWILYFNNWKDPNKIYRAEGEDPKSFTLHGVALETNEAVNDVKKFTKTGKDWYVMGLHHNADRLWYSLSNDGSHFQSQKPLFTHLYPGDKYIVAVGFVCRGESLLGVIYGAGPVPELNRNSLFARWLQKKIVLTDRNGGKTEAMGALGPDRQRIKLPENKPLEAALSVFAEDGSTILAEQPVKLEPGRVYRLVW